MALIPPYFLDCVVALGFDASDGKRKWLATGFLYGDPVEAKAGKKAYRVYLVTNQHVFEGKSIVYLRCNPKQQRQAKEYKLRLSGEDGSLLWFANPNSEIDVAVVSINIRKLQEEGMQVSFFRSDYDVVNIEKLLEFGITEGDFAYVLGFPMGIIGGERSFVVVRSGSIARIRDVLARANYEFLIDASVFPGNSGGPVILKPEATAIKGTKAQHAAYLIGIVKEYVSYQDVAISAQTGKPRVIFEENSGLAAAHPVDSIQEAIEEHRNFLGTKKETISHTETKESAK